MVSLSDVLGSTDLRRLAGTRSYERGVDYAAADRVARLDWHGTEIEASVQGTHRYRVRLWMEEGRPAAACTCPMGADGAFCKHCVATAVVALEAGDRASPSVSLDAVREYLCGLKKAELTDLLVAEAREDERLLDRLRLRAAAGGRKGVDTDALRDAIDRAVDPGGFVSYAEAYDYSRTLDEAIDKLRVVLDGGHAVAAVDLVEHCVAAVERAVELVDDSAGHLSGVFDELQRLHLEACELAQFEPVPLAERLFALMMATEYDLFYEAAKDYASLLGGEGLRRYEELVREEWGRLPELRPGDARPPGTFSLLPGVPGEQRDVHRLTHVMELLAWRSGEVERVVDVLSRDLSSPYAFLRIAEAYTEAGRRDDALMWAERGVDAFPDRLDPRLVVLLADALNERDEHARAAESIWALFADRPGLDSYRRLKPYAERAERWDEIRERALALIRDGLAGGRKGLGAPDWLAHRDGSELVRIHLWEDDGAAALRAARAGGCRQDVWLELADRLAEGDPWEAMMIYREQVEPTIERKSKADYRDAVELLGKTQALMARTGVADEFSAYVREIRETHKRKRNLIVLIDEMEAGS